ncbi:MAG TPA: HEAT repeat domain-containing protein [Prolixibacteraceae bacterium]|nr:HEAT repeat domain-containing protein [Prolixibacteraceae bacterium]
MDIEKLIGEIIPPSDYQHRNGFDNILIIDRLTDNEKKQVENVLIDRLLHKTVEEVDTLIVETLAYLKSEKALPVLKNLLEHCSSEVVKLRIATSIFEINQDNDMVKIAITSFKKLDNNKDSYYVHKLTSAFFYLIKFNKPEVNGLIKEYITHKEYLLSYNAKRALGMQ